jgi:hypothetical protein
LEVTSSGVWEKIPFSDERVLIRVSTAAASKTDAVITVYFEGTKIGHGV